MAKTPTPIAIANAANRATARFERRFIPTNVGGSSTLSNDVVPVHLVITHPVLAWQPCRLRLLRKRPIRQTNFLRRNLRCFSVSPRKSPFLPADVLGSSAFSTFTPATPSRGDTPS